MQQLLWPVALHRRVNVNKATSQAGGRNREQVLVRLPESASQKQCFSLTTNQYQQ
jgi:hypothetical protein